MLSFLTLFLGLIVGAQQVEVVGAPDAARVEFLLDGVRVASLAGEPWRAQVDFGAALLPHRLTAVAYDDSGRELTRAEQWLNLPRSRAEASLLLESPRRVSLVWESLENKRPLVATVKLDGRELESLGGGGYRLPELDAARIHFLSADLEFEGNVRARVEAALGGQFGGETTVEMTAVPLTRKRSAEPPTTDELTGSLVKLDRPLTVVAVEEGSWDLLVVIEPSAIPALGGLGRLIDRGLGSPTDTSLNLPEGAEARFLSPQPKHSATRDIPVDLFPMSTPFTAADGQLPYLTTHMNLGEPGSDLQLADAVAVAGVQAAAGNQPRAVLLVLGTEDPDASRFTVEEVQTYLAALRVPLVVWVTGPAMVRTISSGRRPVTVRTAWGRARDVSSLNRLEDAVRQLGRQLGAQSIAWVEGGHLPQRIGLAASARGLQLAGTR